MAVENDQEKRQARREAQNGKKWPLGPRPRAKGTGSEVCEGDQGP